MLVLASSGKSVVSLLRRQRSAASLDPAAEVRNRHRQLSGCDSHQQWSGGCHVLAKSGRMAGGMCGVVRVCITGLQVERCFTWQLRVLRSNPQQDLASRRIPCGDATWASHRPMGRILRRTRCGGLCFLRHPSIGMPSATARASVGKRIPTLKRLCGQARCRETRPRY
jgi:hypothetical protein